RFASSLATGGVRLGVRMGHYSFPVRLFHSRHHAGLSRRTTNPIFLNRSTIRGRQTTNEQRRTPQRFCKTNPIFLDASTTRSPKRRTNNNERRTPPQNERRTPSQQRGPIDHRRRRRHPTHRPHPHRPAPRRHAASSELRIP